MLFVEVASDLSECSAHSVFYGEKVEKLINYTYSINLQCNIIVMQYSQIINLCTVLTLKKEILRPVGAGGVNSVLV